MVVILTLSLSLLRSENVRHSDLELVEREESLYLSFLLSLIVLLYDLHSAQGCS